MERSERRDEKALATNKHPLHCPIFCCVCAAACATAHFSPHCPVPLASLFPFHFAVPFVSLSFLSLVSLFPFRFTASFPSQDDPNTRLHSVEQWNYLRPDFAASLSTSRNGQKVAGGDASRSSFVQNVSELEVEEDSSAICYQQQQNAHRCKKSSPILLGNYVQTCCNSLLMDLKR